MSDSPSLAVVLKGYPRLSETFIAQELKALEDRGLSFDIWSLRRPYDDKSHPIHAEIAARVFYLPEYLHEEPLRVMLAVLAMMRRGGFWRAAGLWLADLVRDVTRNRVRRFGQACVLAHEAAPELRFLYAHFLHTPGSVARYAAVIRGVEWGFSAHARDIWTIPDWEKREKIADAAFGVTCTRSGVEILSRLVAQRVDLVYHGLDLTRFPPPPARTRSTRNGADARHPVRIVSVGRLVEKKGYDDLLTALADLPESVWWKLTHIGGGPLAAEMRALSTRLGLQKRVTWLGKRDQTEVLEALRDADLFALAARVAEDGDRDGLPNVLLEAASQRLAIVSTRVAAIPEFIEDGVTGVLVRPGDAGELGAALDRLIRSPDDREALGAAACDRLTAHFGMSAGADAIADRLQAALAARP